MQCWHLKGFFVCLFCFVFTVNVLPVADVLQVASRLLPTHIRLLVVRLQPRVGISAELGAPRHAARGRAPHLYPFTARTGRSCAYNLSFPFETEAETTPPSR